MMIILHNSYKKIICKDVKKSDDDTVISFLLDCMKEKNIGNNQLAKMTGIEKGKFNERESIIRFYMDACYFLFECTVANCNNRLSKNKEPLLSLLLPEKEKQPK